jgi:hypothetical protein
VSKRLARPESAAVATMKTAGGSDATGINGL